MNKYDVITFGSASKDLFLFSKEFSKKKFCFAIDEKKFSKSELEMADELFLTNSLFGIWPIKLIAKTRFTKIGEVTKQLQEEVDKICQ